VIRIELGALGRATISIDAGAVVLDVTNAGAHVRRELDPIKLAAMAARCIDPRQAAVVAGVTASTVTLGDVVGGVRWLVERAANGAR